MKHTKHLTLAVLSVIVTSNTIMAQDWTIGGNNVAGAGADRLLGITGPNTKNLVFINGNLGGVPTERGRITNTGLWGIGTIAPNSRFHINGAAGETPFRVQINGASKLYVNSNGGVSAGTSSTPPQNGLLVSGNFRSGTGTFANDVRMQVLGGTDVAPSTGGYFVAGPVNGPNLAIDDNEIMARNNGGVATLYLNAVGGDMNMANSRLVIDADNNKMGVRTAAPATDFHIRHATGSGVSSGLRLENEDVNDENWTFYTQNADGNLLLYENGIFKGEFSDVSGSYSSVSDARFKKDIEKAPALLEKLLQLDIKKYHFLKNKPDDKKYYGMIAQEVEKIFPEVVKHNKHDDNSDVYTMDYTAFGILAIKGLQEQQQTIELLKQQLEAFKEQNEKLEGRLQKMENTRPVSSTTHSDAMKISGASLEQNMPNPFNQATMIRYHVPNDVNATIIVYNSNGTPVKNIQANASGTVTIDAGELSAGTYTYALTVNGKTVASKKMILVK